MDGAHPASSHPASSPDGQVPLGEDVRVCACGWGWHHAGHKNAVLSGVDFDIASGGRVLVLDPSGSGKSTLMGDLAGLLDGAGEGDTTGTLTVDGVTPVETRGRVGLFMQDPEAQVVLVRVDDDVAFGIESLGVARGEVWPHVGNSFEAVDLSVPLDHSTTEPSGEQKQRLTLASILAVSPSLLLLDEPTANLDPSGITEVHATIETVVERTGAAVVVVEHRVDIWAFLVDRTIVVADGMIAVNGPLGEILTQQGGTLREHGIWLSDDGVAVEVGLALKIPPASSESPKGETRGTTPITRVTDLTIGCDASVPIRSGIDLTIERGVSTCIVGANDTGKSTFALTLAGLLPPLAGTVEVRTADGTNGNPREQSSKQLPDHMSMVFQEPRYQFLAATVAEELTIGPRATGMTDEEIAPLINEHLEALGLTRLARANPMTLSGGKKHRLSAATALINAPELLILDEPTFDQDRGTWLGLVRLLRATLGRGVTLVSITHDPAFIAAMSQRVVDLGQVDTRGAAPEDSTNKAGSAPAGSIRDRGPKHGARGLLVRTNPVTRVFALLVATTPLLITIDPVSTAVVVILEFALMPLSGASAHSFFLKATPLLLAAPLGTLSMLLYASPGGTVYWQFGPAAVSDHSMWLALGIGLRMCVIVLPAVVLLDRIDPTDVGDGLAQTLYLPARPILAALADVCVTSLMTADWKALKRARRARDVGDSSRVRSFLRGSSSLLVLMLRRSGELATTMGARDFDAEGERTWVHPSRLHDADVVLMVVAIALSAIALVASIWADTFASVSQ